MKKLFIAAALATTLLSPLTKAADYIVDYKGAHASINFKIKHMGYSWLTGRFDKFDGTFSYDANNVSASKIEVNIDTASVNSNHAKRDKHLRSDDYLDVSKFASAKFVSNSIIDKGVNKLEVKGLFTLHGMSKEITIDATKIGEGKDPWGGYRVGFSGTSSILLSDFGIGSGKSEVFFDLHIEGIRQ